MKTIKKQLKKQLDKMNSVLIKREKIYQKRSQKWKSSQKGVDYSDVTHVIKTAYSWLQVSINDLEYIDNLPLPF